MLKRPEYPKGFQRQVFKDKVREGGPMWVISSWIFWLVGGEVKVSQHHQISGSNWSGVYMLMNSISWISSTWWGFKYLQNSSKNVTQTIYSAWGGAKGPWLCLLTKLVLFCLVWQLSFASAFSHFFGYICSLSNVFLQTRGWWRTWQRRLLGGGPIESSSVIYLQISYQHILIHL